MDFNGNNKLNFSCSNNLSKQRATRFRTKNTGSIQNCVQKNKTQKGWIKNGISFVSS